MSTFAKIMVVVNFVLAIAFLAAAGTLHGAAESWKGRHDVVLDQKTKEIDALNGQIKSKDDQLTTARNETRSLEGRAQAAEAQQKQLHDSNANLMRENEQKNSMIAQLTAANASSSDALKVATTRNEQISNDLAREQADRKQADEVRRTTEENLVRAEQRADTAEKGLAAAEASNKALTDELDSTKVQLTAHIKRHGPLSGSESLTAVKGVVNAASAKDDVFVISVGSKDGVKIGYEFTVSRGDKYVSTIVVDSVFPNHAAGHTKQGMKKLDVQAGDAVSTAAGL